MAHVLHANENRGIRSSEGEEGRRERRGKLTCGGCCRGSQWCSLVAVMLAAKWRWLQAAVLLSSLLCFPSLLLYFFPALFPFLFFFWSSALFFLSPLLLPLLCLCIYRQRRAVKMPYPCPIRGQGRVDGGASWGLSLLFFFVCGRPPVSIQASGVLRSASFWVLGERGRGEMSVKIGEQNLLLPLFSVRLGEEESLQCRLKRHRFRLLSFFWVNSRWNGVVFPKTRRFI